EDIDPAQSLYCLVHHRGEGSGVSKVRLDGKCSAPGASDLSGHLFSVFISVEIAKGNVRAFLGELQDNSAADAAVAAGDYGFSVGKEHAYPFKSCYLEL